MDPKQLLTIIQRLSPMCDAQGLINIVVCLCGGDPDAIFKPGSTSPTAPDTLPQSALQGLDRATAGVVRRVVAEHQARRAAAHEALFPDANRLRRDYPPARRA